MNGSNKKTREFSPQTGAYKVLVKGQSTWVNYKTATLGISVGKDIHEGEKFEALCLWANERFEHVSILICDSLQRYNLMIKDTLSEDFALHKSIKEGDKWLERNSKALNLLKNKTIIRWDDYRLRPEFEEKLKLVNNHYNNNERFKTGVNKQATNMFCRQYIDKPAEGAFFEKLTTLSVKYILEETAISSIIETEIKSINVYPGTFAQVWDQFKENPVEGLEELSNMACNRVGFRKNKSFQTPSNDTLRRKNIA